MRKVPIQNIYYIILYAWDHVNNKNIYQAKSKEEIGSLHDVLVDMFLTETERIVRTGLRKEYIANVHESRFIKGKIDVNETIRRTNGMIVSEYDEFEDNHILNQLLKAFLLRVYFATDISEQERKRVRRILLHFENVDTVQMTPYMWRSVQYNRLTKNYQFPLELGKFLYDSSIPAEDREGYVFHHILEKEETMSTLFEKFILNYYKRHYPYEVKFQRHGWNLTPIGNSNESFIPKMLTDIQILRDDEHIVIDAKYYKKAFIKSFRKEIFRPAHMYQISAYMDKLKAGGKPVRGILMYPSNGYDFYEQYRMEDGSIIGFKTINLGKDWQQVESDLAAIFNSI